MLEKIKYAVRAIDDELLSAEHYAKMAHKCKGSDNAAMQTYLAMAKRTVSEAKNANDPCLHGIEAIWELESDRMAPWIVKIKMMMDGM